MKQCYQCLHGNALQGNDIGQQRRFTFTALCVALPLAFIER